MGIRLVPKVSEITLMSNIWQKKKNQVNAIMHTQFDGIIFLTNMKCYSLCRMLYYHLPGKIILTLNDSFLDLRVKVNTLKYCIKCGMNVSDHIA